MIPKHCLLLDVLITSQVVLEKCKHRFLKYNGSQHCVEFQANVHQCRWERTTKLRRKTQKANIERH